MTVIKRAIGLQWIWEVPCGRFTGVPPVPSTARFNRGSVFFGGAANPHGRKNIKETEDNNKKKEIIKIIIMIMKKKACTVDTLGGEIKKKQLIN